MSGLGGWVALWMISLRNTALEHRRSSSVTEAALLLSKSVERGLDLHQIFSPSITCWLTLA